MFAPSLRAPKGRSNLGFKSEIAAARFAGLAMTLASLLLVPNKIVAEQTVRVVATLSTFADLAKQIGGDRIEVSTIASPRFNPHFIEPRPSDVLRVKKADLFVHAGLDLEMWRGPLLDAAGNPRIFPGQPGELDLSKGVYLLEIPTGPVSRWMGDIHLFGNPHYWLDPENARVMAQAIRDKLCALDPAHEQEYHRNLRSFLTRLDRKVPEWKSALEPFRGQEMVGYHNEWPYLVQFAGLKMQRFLEPKPGVPPGPRHLQQLEADMKMEGIRVIVQPTYYSRSASESLAARTQGRVVILCQNVGELPEAGDYFAWMEFNVRQLSEGLNGG